MPKTQLRGATIVGTGSALPERILSNFDLEKMVETSDEWIVTRTGIRERRMVAEGQDNSDLAAEATMKALEAAGLTVQDIDHIFVATVTPDRILPSMACTVQQKIGASHAACLDINAACSGFLYGLQVGQSLIQSGASAPTLSSACAAPTLAAAYPADNSAPRNSIRRSINPFPATVSSRNLADSILSRLFMKSPSPLGIDPKIKRPDVEESLT